MTFIDVMATAVRTQTCVPQQSMSLNFTPRSGPLVISVTSTRSGDPSGDDTGIVGKPGDEPEDDIGLGIRTLSTRLDVHVGGMPPQRFDLGGGLVSLEDSSPPIIEIELPAASNRRSCRIVVTNTSGTRSRIRVHARYVGGRHRQFTTRVPIALLNGAARELVKGLGVELRLDGDDSFLDFSEDLKRHAGGALQRRRFNALSTNDINLRTVSAVVTTVGSGADRRPVFDVMARFEEAGREIKLSVIGAELVDLAIRIRFEVDRLLGYRATVSHGILVDGNLFVDTVEAVIQGITGFLGVFGIGGGSKDFTDLLQDLGGVVEDMLNDRTTRGRVRDFLQDGMMTLVHRGDVFDVLDTSEDALVVRHHDPRVEEPPPRPAALPAAPRVTGGPEDAQDALRLVERIDHVVVLMLENRSFDHLFGHLSLPASGRTDVDGLRGDESNGVPGVSVAVEELTDTRFPFSPDHSHAGVVQQIAGGTMNGFVSSFVDSFPLVDITESHPMGYYTGETLPAYRFLTDNFLVCDRWFCSHPGGTWPNRFAAFCGQTPSLDNFALDDPRIGYTRLASVFDRLPRADWRVYESDIAFLRMFERHRLDDANIQPMSQFADDVAAGDLPLFTWLEPNYTDVVPVDRVADDDHPPADLMQGQRLLERTYNALRSSALWDRTMLVVTYDEHGGFYDHVPPPGTNPNGSDGDEVEPQPRIHPDGDTFLGPRVPALVISPWVDAGASSTSFEHTSIAKTVLLRRFGASWPDMGERLAGSRSLGAVLRDERRTTAGEMPPIDPPRPPNPFPGGRPPPIDDDDDFHEAMRRFPTG